MKVILDCLKKSRHWISLISFTLLCLSNLALAEPAAQGTDEFANWSAALGTEERTALAKELVTTLYNGEQFVTIDGLSGMFDVSDHWIGHAQDGSVNLIINATPIGKEGEDEPTLEIAVPKIFEGEVDHIEPAEVRIRDQQ
ncbi:MAG: hypothetical protein AAF202_05005 [Pseudomonadota bacterium]